MAYTNIDDPSAHYQGLLYTGDSSSTTSSDRNLTNTGNSDLQPDWIWLFNRDTQLNDDNPHEVGYRHLFYQESTYGFRTFTNSSGSAANDYDPGVSNSVAQGDVFGVALDMDNGKISFYKNGSNMYGSTLHDLGALATSSLYEGSVVPLFVNYSSLRELHVNFGGYCYTYYYHFYKN